MTTCKFHTSSILHDDWSTQLKHRQKILWFQMVACDSLFTFMQEPPYRFLIKSKVSRYQVPAPKNAISPPMCFRMWPSQKTAWRGEHHTVDKVSFLAHGDSWLCSASNSHSSRVQSSSHNLTQPAWYLHNEWSLLLTSVHKNRLACPHHTLTAGHIGLPY